MRVVIREQLYGQSKYIESKLDEAAETILRAERILDNVLN